MALDLIPLEIRQMGQGLIGEERQRLLQCIIAVRSICAIIRRLSQLFGFAANASNDVNRTIHRPKMDSSQVFAHHAKREKLCA